MTIKNQWTNDKERTTRTLEAMEYNMACRQAMIDKLIETNRLLEEEITRLREEIVALEWDKRAKVIN